MESPRTEIPLQGTHETTPTTPNSIPSNVPTSYMRLDTQSVGKRPESDLPSMENVIKTKRLNTSCIPSIVEEATTPQASPTNLPASSGEAQPSKLAERTKKDLKSVGQWERVSVSPSTNYIKSWITVDGELVLSKNGQPLQQTEGPEAVDHSLKESESLGNAVKVTGPGKIDGTKYSDTIISDQSHPLPEPTSHSPRQSSKKEDKNPSTSSDLRSQGPTTALTGSQLISQLETILKETGNIKVVKPSKFKDAVGRKFSFPWELACTWAGMEELIRQAFLHVEGLGPHIAEGRYDLIGPNGEIILPRVWETTIEPDWAISMHMWPIPEPPKPKHAPPPSLMRGGPGGPPAPPPLAWMSGPSRTRSRSSSPSTDFKPSNIQGWLKKANKLFSHKDKDDYTDTDSLSGLSLFSIRSKKNKKNKKRR